MTENELIHYSVLGMKLGIDNEYRNSGRAGSLQQRIMMSEYELRKSR